MGWPQNGHVIKWTMDVARWMDVRRYFLPPASDVEAVEGPGRLLHRSILTPLDPAVISLFAMNSTGLTGCQSHTHVDLQPSLAVKGLLVLSICSLKLKLSDIVMVNETFVSS